MLIAADTNVLLDLALEVEPVVDAVTTIRQRLPDARLVVPPTAIHELALATRTGGTERIRKAAFRALSQIARVGFRAAESRASGAWHRRADRRGNPAQGFGGRGGNE